MSFLAVSLSSLLANAAALFYIPSKPLLEDPVVCLQTTTAVLFIANLVVGLVRYEARQENSSLSAKAAVYGVSRHRCNHSWNCRNPYIRNSIWRSFDRKISKYFHVRTLRLPPHGLPCYVRPQGRPGRVAQGICGASPRCEIDVTRLTLSHTCHQTNIESREVHLLPHHLHHLWSMAGSDSLAHLMCHQRISGALPGARGGYDRELFACG
ncbi:hypothetical protein BC938DRAFT_483356 [Jimgerdemannia flammicorona]|uniref:Uncharacterized protein n=1 Tax=Jimgerdemannia flammicorona TaxID=994334 RepID=A0A433QC72_9FUNG|nr:hypothetical protein BC938DRAFT_483356 [Jimgerdemannia flammicorona]